MYEYTVLPQGFCNAPSTFQRLMNNVMGKHIDDFLLVYLDDILIFSTTEYEHEHYLRLILKVKRAYAPGQTQEV